MSRIISRILRSSFFKKFIILCVSLIGFFVLVNYIIMPLYVHRGRTLTIPNVTGVSIDSAIAILTNLDLSPVQSETRPDPKYTVGTVAQQNPEEGSMVKQGRRVYLTVSGGEQLVNVPSLRGMSTRDARFTLERYGFRLGRVLYDTSARYPENTIAAQSVPPQTKLSRGSKVGITISRGAIIEEVHVPEVVGKTLGEGEKVLVKANLKIGNITYQVSEDLVPNTIIDQFPRSGESVQRGQAIDLFVAKLTGQDNPVQRKR